MFFPNFLQQVQDSFKARERNIGLLHQHNDAGNEKILQDSVPAPLPVRRSNPGWRSREVRATKGKTKSDQSEAFSAEQAGGELHRHFCSPHSAPAARSWWDVTSLRRRASSKLQASFQESRGHRQAPETNVDTGLTVVNAAGGRCPLDRFPRELRSCLLQPPAPRDGAGRTQLPFAAAESAKGAGQRAPGFPLQTPRPSPAGRAEENEEEFFI